MKNVLKIVFVIIGTLIGAGFASGQEIYVFFYSYGILGILGILLSSIIIGIVIYKTLKIVHYKKIENYKQFLDEIIKIKSNKKFLNIKNITNNIINIFVLITFFIMIAGFGAYFQEQLGIHQLIGSSILAIMCFFVFRKNINGVVKVNEIIVPILILFIIIIGFINITNIQPNIQNIAIQNNNSNWIISALSYGGYNSILLIPVLITLKDLLDNIHNTNKIRTLDKKQTLNSQILKIFIITTTIISILALIIFSMLTNVGEEIKNIEMPVAFVVSKMPYILQIIYGIIILSSIFTTSVSLGNSFLMNIKGNKTIISIIICISSVIFSKIGFSNLITTVYPIFGILGLIQILQILLTKNIKSNKF